MKNSFVQLCLEKIKIKQKAPDGSRFSGETKKKKKKKVQQKNLLLTFYSL